MKSKKNSTTLMIVPLIGAFVLSSACDSYNHGVDAPDSGMTDSDKNRLVTAERNSAVQEVPDSEPSESVFVRGGALANGFPGLVEVGDCTGTMIGPSIILTAAHCFSFAAGSSRLATVEVRYFEPGLPANSPRWLASSVRVHTHADYRDGGDRANHDIAIVETIDGSHWQNTDHQDYARLYQDYGSRLPDYLRLYGRGYSTLSGSGIGTLRHASFEVHSRDSYKIVIHNTNKRGVCRGDSGGPFFVASPLNIIACIASHGTDPGYCNQDTGIFDMSRATCSRSVRANVVDLIVEKTNVSCTIISDNGRYDYSRCFDVPFVNSVDGEGFERGQAVGILAAIL